MPQGLASSVLQFLVVVGCGGGSSSCHRSGTRKANNDVGEEQAE